MPEKEPPKHPEQTPNTEQETPGYWQAARFKGEREAGRCYQACQRLIRDPDVNLSAFRFQLNRVYHVAIIGPTSPPEDIAKNVDEFLSLGEPAILPTDIIKMLQERRKHAMSPGTTRVEDHYRPGKRL